MNRKLHTLTILLGGVIAAGSASAQQAGDEVPASFQRMLDHRPTAIAAAPESTADPLVAYLLAALHEIRQRDTATTRASSVVSPPAPGALATSFQRMLGEETDLLPQAFVADGEADPLVEHLAAALYAGRDRANAH